MPSSWLQDARDLELLRVRRLVFGSKDLYSLSVGLEMLSNPIQEIIIRSPSLLLAFAFIDYPGKMAIGLTLVESRIHYFLENNL